MTNPVENLAGRSWTDFIDIAYQLADADRDAFLRDLRLASNWEEGGQRGVIDRGLEALEVARLLIRLPDDQRPKSITATDIRLYEVSLAGERAILESDVRRIAGELATNPNRLEITFRDTVYNIGTGLANRDINNALEEAGSYMRFFAGQAILPRDGRYGVVVIFGRMMPLVGVPERHEGVRRIYIDQPEISHNIRRTSLGVNDMQFTAVVLGDRLRAAMERCGIGEENVEAFVHLVMRHEMAHLRNDEEFGPEKDYLQRTLAGLGNIELVRMDELYTDLAVVAGIADMPESTAEEKAEKINAFRIWSTFRRGPDDREVLEPYFKYVSDILLSAAGLEGGQLVVDWEGLREKATSLMAVLRDAFKDIKYGIQLAAVAGELDSIEGEPDRSHISHLYHTRMTELVGQLGRAGRGLAGRESLADGKRRPELPDFLVGRMAANWIVDHEVLRKGSDKIDPVMVTTFTIRIDEYKRRVEDWMTRELGIDRKSTPY